METMIGLLLMKMKMMIRKMILSMPLIIRGENENDKKGNDTVLD